MIPTQGILFPVDTTDFGIEIDFVPSTTDPSRVFRAMTQLITTCESIDAHLASAFSLRATPVILLQGIESRSLLTWLRSTVQSVDDEALKSGDWKKVLGTYLVTGKGRIIKFLEKRETISNADEIYDLQRVLHEAAKQTNIPLTTEPAVPAVDVAESILALSEATDPLIEGDGVKYLSADGTDILNTRFRVTAERIEEILTHEIIVNTDKMILKVKKPDFLGDSMWDFRYEGKKLAAKVQDTDWLKQFHNGEVLLRPGDALRGLVEIQTKYGQDEEVIAIHHRVLKVEEVIQKTAQKPFSS